MKNRLLVLCGIILLLGFGFCYVYARQSTYSYVYGGKNILLQPTGDQYVVKFAHGVSESVASESLSRLGFIQLEILDFGKGNKVSVVRRELKDTPQLASWKSGLAAEFIMPIFSDERGRRRTVLNQVIVNFRDYVSRDQIEKLNKEYGIKILECLDGIKKQNRYLLGLGENSELTVFDVARIYRANSLVEYADPDFFSFSTAQATTPNDSLFNSQWALSKVNAPNAWDISTGNSNIYIAVIDGGFDLQHEDLAGKFVQGHDHISNDDNPSYVGSADRHGTACAGIIGAATNNTHGVAGLAWNCKIMPLRAALPSGMESAVASQAFIWATEHDAHVVSMSHSGLQYSDDLNTQMSYALESGRGGKGCVVVISSGNNDQPNVDYPANRDNVIAVGATDSNDVRWVSGAEGSNYGSALDVMAPGGSGIWTTDLTGSDGYTQNNYYSNFGGTSAAAPHVAALAGLILSQNNDLTRLQVEQIIELSAIDLGDSGRDNNYGWGRINAWNALRITISGEIPGNEVWRGSVSLSGNVTIPTGKKLTILSGTSVTLNGHSITTSSGSITIESGASLGSYALLQQGSSTRGIYPSIQAALSAASSGQSVNVSSGTYTFSDSLTVSSGVTLQTGTATTFSFTGAYKLRIDGKLVANGTTFTRSGGQWYGIEFYNGSSGSSIGNCTIQNAQYGIYTYGTEVSVDGSTISNNTRGVYVNNTSGTFSHNTIQDNTRGFDCENYGDPNIIGNNILKLNSWAVYTDATSAPNLGIYTGYNSIHLNDYYDVYSNYSGTIYARGNWWGSYPASPSYYGTLDYSNAFSSDINGRMAEVPPRSGPVGILAKLAANPDTSGMKKLNEAYIRYANGDYEVALGLFQDIAAQYRDAFSGSRALVFADRIMEKLGRDAKANLYTTINRSPRARVASVAGSLLVSRLVKEGSYKDALNEALALINDQDKSIVKDALYNAGNILWYKFGDRETGKSYLTRLIAEFPDDPLSASAQSTLGESAPPSIKLPRAGGQDPTKNLLEVNNYPNPFNPSTIIQYTIPENGHTSLKVFDLLGREVEILVNEFKVAGTYEARFDASSLPSGVYVYRLVTAGKSLVQKMTLLR